MNEKTNVDFLKSQIKKAIQTISENKRSDVSLLSFDNIIFKLQLDINEKQGPKTNFDEIMYYRVLPDKIGSSLTIDEVCDVLTTGKNEIPLYADLTVIEINKAYLVTTSKRFRKRNEVEKYHDNSDLTPFRVDKNEW
jgi:hypothetical protein